MTPDTVSFISSVAGRLDLVVTNYLKVAVEVPVQLRTVSRSAVAKWIEEGQVAVAGRVVRKAGARIEVGYKIELRISEPAPFHLLADSTIKFEVIFEDQSILVINKPKGLVVHPGAGAREHTLVHGLLHYLGDQIVTVGDKLRPGLVHRLDRDTTGLMVIAKNNLAFQSLVGQFKPPRTIHRTYLAVVTKLPSGRGAGGIIDLAIGRSQKDRKIMVPRSDGRSAVTRWHLVEQLKFGYLLKLHLDTGRTHQIRVHLQASGAPILGDRTYGAPVAAIPHRFRTAVTTLGRQALHASELSFVHPETTTEVKFVAPIPDDIEELLKVLRT